MELCNDTNSIWLIRYDAAGKTYCSLQNNMILDGAVTAQVVADVITAYPLPTLYIQSRQTTSHFSYFSAVVQLPQLASNKHYGCAKDRLPCKGERCATKQKATRKMKDWFRNRLPRRLRVSGHMTRHCVFMLHAAIHVCCHFCPFLHFHF